MKILEKETETGEYMRNNLEKYKNLFLIIPLSYITTVFRINKSVNKDEIGSIIIISIDSLANEHALHVKRYFNHITIKTDIAGMLFIKNDTHNKAECKIIFSAK